MPFSKLMAQIFDEYKKHQSIFGVRKIFKAIPTSSEIETAVGVASGSHTEMSQSLVCAYVAGARYFELKTVNAVANSLENLAPYIFANDEVYSVSNAALSVPDALDEYIKAWFALKLISKEFSLGDPDKFVFIMSLGYTLDSLLSENLSKFIDTMKNAKNSQTFADCRTWAVSNLNLFENTDLDYINSISCEISNSVILSVENSLPVQEISTALQYLIEQKGLNTCLKIGATLLGHDNVRSTLDTLGYDYIELDKAHFENKFTYDQFKLMVSEILNKHGGNFGVKVVEALPVLVDNSKKFMSGRSLFPIAVQLASKVASDFDGKLKISFCGGADAHSVQSLLKSGLSPVTICSSLLKPDGYNKLTQIAEMSNACEVQAYPNFNKISNLAKQALNDSWYIKPIKPLPSRKINNSLPLTDCFIAPCRVGCPIFQDIPAYLKALNENNPLKALKIITERNPLPNITGTICPHKCMDKCKRNFCDCSVDIRGSKLTATENSFDQLMAQIKSVPSNGKKVAIVGGGPAGLSAAYLLAKSGCDVTVFEKDNQLGGIVAKVIPDFRISNHAIEQDIKLCSAFGAKFELGHIVNSIDELRENGFEFIVLAIGANVKGTLKLEYGECINAIDFLEQFKSSQGNVNIGKNVVIIGGGNTAMDAARAAVRTSGVEKVSLVYRRTRRYMPADEEELGLAISDGVQFCELLAPVGVGNGVLECKKMVLGEPDEKGRRSPVATDEIVNVPADTVIVAVGEHIDSPFYEKCGISLNKWGEPILSPSTMETNIEKLYVIGDGSHGPATVVEAIFEATKVVRGICGSSALRYSARNSVGNLSDCYNKKGITYSECTSHTDSQACLSCAKVCESCVDVCPNRANIAVKVKNRIQIVHIDDMCNQCGNCETFCPYNSAPYKSKFTLFGSQDSFSQSDNQGFLPITENKSRVRLNAQVYETELGDGKLPANIESLIQSVLSDYPHLIS